MKKGLDIKKLRRLLGKCLDEGIAMSILTTTDRTSFTLDEVRHITIDAYLLGLEDALEYLDGDPQSLEELVEDGKAVILDPREKCTVIHVPREELSKAR